MNDFYAFYFYIIKIIDSLQFAELLIWKSLSVVKDLPHSL